MKVNNEITTLVVEELARAEEYDENVAAPNGFVYCIPRRLLVEL